MTSPTCQKCDCVKGCQSIPSPCPILLAECIASGQVSAAQIEAHRVLDDVITQPTIKEPLKVHVNAEQYMLHKYGAFRGHFAWREIQSAYAQGQLDAAIAQPVQPPIIEGSILNAACILASDMPHTVIEKINKQLLKAHPEQPSELTWYGCGDGYPAESFEAGVISSIGNCSNCAAIAQPKDKP